MSLIPRILPHTLDLVEQGIRQRLHLGAQVYVSQRGQPVADVAIGEARPGVPMTTDTIMLWLSSSKPFGAVALAQLWERGHLTLDDPVMTHIPEFGVRGKDVITIRHILTHTGGFRGIDMGSPAIPWEETIRRICELPVERGWIPGQKAGYHLVSSWFILGELVRRIDGRPYDAYVREEIFEPLRMTDAWFAMTPERHRAYGDRISLMYHTDGPEPSLYPWHAEDRCAWVSPGGSGRGRLRELGRFYEMLLGHGQLDGARLLTPQTVEALTARHRVGMLDHTFKHVLDWGLGFIINSNLYGAETVPYGYGRHASARTFGHGGFQSSAGFADPEHGLVVALAFNGIPGEARHQERVREVHTAIYEELGLV